MRTILGLTIGSAFSGLLIGSYLLAGPAQQPTPSILLSQVIETNPGTPRDQEPMRPIEGTPKPFIEQNPTPPREQEPMRPLEEMPKPFIEQKPAPPGEQKPTPPG
jgi:hypothetical protein